MSEKLLTISIAAYNVEQYLEQALTSCLVREDLKKKIEVIVVNDGSTDNTLKIANRYAEQYPDIYVVVDKKNSGYGSTVNKSISMAKGKYFKILDGDDWINTDGLEAFLDVADKCSEDLILSKTKKIFWSEKKIIKEDILANGEIEEEKTYDFNTDYNINWYMHNMIVSTEFLRKNKICLTEKCFYTDGEYVFKVISHLRSFRYIDKVIYMYRLGRVGQSVGYEGRIRHKSDSIKVLKNELEYFVNTHFNTNNVRNACKKHLTNTATGVIQYHLLCPYTEENVKKVQEIDLWIKKNYFEIYQDMNKKKAIYILRFFNYKSYAVCRWNELRKILFMKYA